MAAALFVLLGFALLGTHGASGAGEERVGGGGAVLQGPGMEAAGRGRGADPKPTGAWGLGAGRPGVRKAGPGGCPRQHGAWG